MKPAPHQPSVEDAKRFINKWRRSSSGSVHLTNVLTLRFVDVGRAGELPVVIQRGSPSEWFTVSS